MRLNILLPTALGLYIIFAIYPPCESIISMCPQTRMSAKHVIQKPRETKGTLYR